MDNNILANMVFVSSFESKSGFAIEAVAKKIAILKFGKENVPTIVNPKGIPYSPKNEENINGQIIVTNIDTDNSKLRGFIASYRARNMAKGRGKTRVESKVTQETKRELCEFASQFVDGCVHIKPVDLAFFDGEQWNLLELKAGGDLDSSNAPSNIEKLLTIYACLNEADANIYFATLYNKDGEGKTWKGAVKKHMAYPEMFLIGKDFWNKILHDSINFERFTELYRIALDELDLNKRILNMISETIEHE
ncbi:TPA: TdeIII family type II restriction endonuclease [Streptococcus suis]|nr:TdeIII family type II restriction endonuclease [Streptococcus suis]